MNYILKPHNKQIIVGMYVDLVKFVLPLGVTLIVTDVGQMVGNAAISRLSGSNSDTIGVFTAVYVHFI